MRTVDAAFRAWLNGIASHDGTGMECAPLSDRDILVALYDETSGPNWANRANWLTDRPLGDWHGIDVDTHGRVTSLVLWDNGLTGTIPPELGGLISLKELTLRSNELTGPIPPQLGGLANLRTLDLYDSKLMGTIPAELGGLTSLTYLNISDNELTGPIPPKLGRLVNLEEFFLDRNNLTGPIPPQLGSLKNLRELSLGGNKLTGTIPAQLGKLANLIGLHLPNNALTGAIPAQLGSLSSLWTLQLYNNALTGAIPGELGGLANLSFLSLDDNELTGPIPPQLGSLSRLEELTLSDNALTGAIPVQLGSLSNLRQLDLSRNELTGPIPVQLGLLANLEDLDLRANELTGSIPAELGGLRSLREMILSRNAGLSGALPGRLTSLHKLEVLQTGNTGLCAPWDARFLDWLDGVWQQRVVSCRVEAPAAAYLTQAVQSREFPVPLVAGENALLRVFVTATSATQEPLPPVRATFYRHGAQTHVVDILGNSHPIPNEVVEGDLGASVSAEIPGRVLQPGLEMVMDVDPGGLRGSNPGVAKRIPERGRLAVDVRAMPVFKLTVIPFLWRPAPDDSILELAEGMSQDPEGHSLLWATRTLLPVRELEVKAHSSVLTSTNNAWELVSQAAAIRAMEGGSGHYMGMMTGQVVGASGVADRPGWSSFAKADPETIAHELGHNLNLQHAPCNTTWSTDPFFPQTDGSIGAWGYDFREGGRLLPPNQPDLMSYCRPGWISEYHFSNALRFRLNTAAASAPLSFVSVPARSLLLWGGVDAGGVPFLEPAFVVDAPPSLPRRTGGYEITGRTAAGGELFSVSFKMPDRADGDGRSSFAFVLPVQPGWSDELADITLSGPGGSVRLDENTDRPVTILRNRGTGHIRGILRELPLSAVTRENSVSPLSLDSGMEVVTSRGLPGREDWRR